MCEGVRPSIFHAVASSKNQQNVTHLTIIHKTCDFSLKPLVDGGPPPHHPQSNAMWWYAELMNK